MVHQRFDSEFSWLTEQVDVTKLDLDNIGHNTRRPVFWLKQQDSAVYFINGSNECLDLVIANTQDTKTPENMARQLPEKRGFFYDNQMPNQGVKVFEYSNSGDRSSDLVLNLRIKSRHHNHLKLSIAANLNNQNAVVLLWNTGEVGETVELTKGL
ncbi:hypothetical protein [Shewanella gelidii]|uniref:Uncharacterized protein n=1 Tax=Shewanella gelidii TaxID=1642821 RepID=A0A917JYQ4_9GAMM|nr:hypothetical protein [Shewanella gelidii]MCL1098112.1 hypothetical protein [Shewanella gelidii]GGI90643.1 hypothetical protein GCM10009332_29880 [Shewanella gelidii]